MDIPSACICAFSKTTSVQTFDDENSSSSENISAENNICVKRVASIEVLGSNQSASRGVRIYQIDMLRVHVLQVWWVQVLLIRWMHGRNCVRFGTPDLFLQLARGFLEQTGSNTHRITIDPLRVGSALL